MNPKGKAVIFSAPSGAGKTTIVKALLDKSLPLEFSISACSRDPRPGETDGIDYHFLGINGFKLAVENDQFLEWEEVYVDQFYGTLKSEIDRIAHNGKAVIFDVDAYGGVNIKKMLGSNALSVFIQPPSLESLRHRLIARGTESPDKVEMRISKAAEELELKDEFDLVIINDNLEQAIEEAFNAVSSFLA